MNTNARFNQTGKRSAGAVCGSEFIVSNAGSGQATPLHCHGRTMPPKG